MKSTRTLLILFIISLFPCANGLFAQGDKPVIRFGLIADTQYADHDPQGSRYYRNSLGKLESSIDSFNDRKVQFTINLGDIIDRDIKDLDSVLTCLQRLDHTIYHTTGNHDYKGTTDNNILYKRLGMPSEYYSLQKKNWVFIFLNTNEVSAYANIAGTGKECELSAMHHHIKSTGGSQGARWNGGISQKQLRWLDSLLKKSGKSGKNVLILSHHPLYPESEFTALNNQEILDVIGRYSCVKAILSGHHHHGAFAYFNTIPVITVEGMIETENENAFGIVNIYNDKIELEGKGRMTSRILTY